MKKKMKEEEEEKAGLGEGGRRLRQQHPALTRPVDSSLAREGVHLEALTYPRFDEACFTHKDKGAFNPDLPYPHSRGRL